MTAEELLKALVHEMVFPSDGTPDLEVAAARIRQEAIDYVYALEEGPRDVLVELHLLDAGLLLRNIEFTPPNDFDITRGTFHSSNPEEIYVTGLMMVASSTEVQQSDTTINVEYYPYVDKKETLREALIYRGRYLARYVHVPGRQTYTPVKPLNWDSND